jgi:hypothetical protein
MIAAVATSTCQRRVAAALLASVTPGSCTRGRCAATVARGRR